MASEFWYDDVKRPQEKEPKIMEGASQRKAAIERVEELVAPTIVENDPGVVIDPKPGTKDTNPKDAVATKRPYLSVVPCPVLFELGGAMLEGALKYGRHNYRDIGVRASVYYDAAMRHMMLWFEGEDIDPDSGFPHLVKAMACITIVRDAAIRGKLVDDRPPTTVGWMHSIAASTSQLIDKYPNPKPAYTNKRG